MKRVLVLAMMMSLWAGNLMAQHAPELRGRVLDAATGTPLSDAEVLSSDGSRTTTDGDGSFVLRALRPGNAQLTVRRVGYAPMEREVSLANGSSASMTFLLTAAAVQLAELTASGSTLWVLWSPRKSCGSGCKSPLDWPRPMPRD